MKLHQPVYTKVRRIFVAFTRRKLGDIPAGIQITGLWAYVSNSPVFSDWLFNNNVKRSQIVLRRGYIVDAELCSIYGPTRL